MRTQMCRQGGHLKPAGAAALGMELQCPPEGNLTRPWGWRWDGGEKGLFCLPTK